MLEIMYNYAMKKIKNHACCYKVSYQTETKKLTSYQINFFINIPVKDTIHVLTL